jgi:hypothetical protein
MPFNNAGVFLRLFSWVNDAANNIKISSSRMDQEMNGMAAGLSDCVTRDGQSPWLANLPAGGFKITGLGAGSGPGDSVRYEQVLKSASNLSDLASPVAARSSTGLNIDQITFRGDANYQILTTDRVVWLNVTLSAPRTFTLPQAGTCNGGQTLIVVDGSGAVGANSLSFAAFSGDVLTGNAAITTTFGMAIFVCSGGGNEWCGRKL